LDQNDANYEHNRLEALWVTWGANQVDQELLGQMAKSSDHRVRAAATRVVRYTGHQVKDQGELLMRRPKIQMVKYEWKQSWRLAGFREKRDYPS